MYVLVMTNLTEKSSTMHGPFDIEEAARVYGSLQIFRINERDRPANPDVYKFEVIFLHKPVS